MRLLCLSNGHGEDAIASAILQALQALPHAPHIEVLPIVGEGYAYAKNNFPMIANTKAMPSGGFIYMDGKQLANDLRGGLLTLTLEQLRSIRQWGLERRRNNEPAIVLAVGDVVPMFFAWQSGLPFAFVGTAKSEYYLRDDQRPLKRDRWTDDRLAYLTGSVYYPWERWFMTRPTCKAVFPRDRITTDTLQHLSVPAYDLGNPMMDLDIDPDLLSPQTRSELPITVLLLPGSRSPEAYRNWDVILSSVQNLCETFDRPLHFLVALSPGLDRDPFAMALRHMGWNLEVQNSDYELEGSRWRIQGNASSLSLTLGGGSFSNYAHRAEVAIAMAGTATEQFVGLGKLALTLSGEGPQFTPTFAEAQTRLLGCSILKLDQPMQTAAALAQFIDSPVDRNRVAANGRRRMGEPGSASRIAQKLIEILSYSSVAT